MKTILVLTDFSPGADHAAHYALKLAQKIKANLLLCNIFPAPPTEPMSSQIALPIAKYQGYEQDSINDLTALSGRLSKHLDNILTPDEFRPEIEQCSKAGSVAIVAGTITANPHVLLAVISTHNAEGLSAFFLGDHANQIIDRSNCPVLVIPYQATFTGFRKISFATNLSHDGKDILHSLYGLTRYFDSEILITHVTSENPKLIEELQKVNDFFNQEPSRVDDAKIYYRAIKNKNVIAGLDWLTEHTDIDLLVLVHRKRNFFQKMFEGSVTQKMAKHTTKPLLVLPFSKTQDSLPVLQ